MEKGGLWNATVAAGSEAVFGEDGRPHRGQPSLGRTAVPIADSRPHGGLPSPWRTAAPMADGRLAGGCRSVGRPSRDRTAAARSDAVSDQTGERTPFYPGKLSKSLDVT